jgi:hypothetical protein
MNGYYCYVLSRQGRISARHDFECETDAEAMIHAAGIAASSENYPVIEVWSGSRIVGRVPQLELTG